MKITKILSTILVLNLFGLACTFGQAYQKSFDVRILEVPKSVIIDRNPNIYYELYLTNFSSDTLALKGIEAFDAVDSTVFISLDDEGLKKRSLRVGTAETVRKNIFLPGSSKLIYLEFALPGTKPGVQLAHKIQFASPHGRVNHFQSDAIQISDTPQLVIGSPLG